MTVDYTDYDNRDDKFIDIDSDTDTSFPGLMSDNNGVLGEDTNNYKDEIQDDDSGYGEEETSHRNKYSQCVAYRADNSDGDQKNDADCHSTGCDDEAISHDHVLFGNYDEEEAYDDQGDADRYEQEFGDFIVDDELGEEIEGDELKERPEDNNDLIFEGFISDGEEADL